MSVSFASERVHVMDDDGSTKTYVSYETQLRDKETGDVFILGAMFIDEKACDLFTLDNVKQLTTSMDDMLAMEIINIEKKYVLGLYTGDETVEMSKFDALDQSLLNQIDKWLKSDIHNNCLIENNMNHEFWTAD